MNEELAGEVGKILLWMLIVLGGTGVLGALLFWWYGPSEDHWTDDEGE